MHGPIVVPGLPPVRRYRLPPSAAVQRDLIPHPDRQHRPSVEVIGRGEKPGPVLKTADLARCGQNPAARIDPVVRPNLVLHIQCAQPHPGKGASRDPLLFHAADATEDRVYRCFRWILKPGAVHQRAVCDPPLPGQKNRNRRVVKGLAWPAGGMGLNVMGEVRVAKGRAKAAIAASPTAQTRRRLGFDVRGMFEGRSPNMRASLPSNPEILRQGLRKRSEKAGKGPSCAQAGFCRW